MENFQISDEWFEYLEYTDLILKNKKFNEYSVSNPFLHPSKPTFSRLKILKELKNINIISNYKLKIKFFIYLLRALKDIVKQLFISKKYIFKKITRLSYVNYDSIFVSHINSSKRFDTEFDEYFGNMINDLSKSKKILLILFPHCNLSKKRLEEFLKKNRKYDVYVFENSLVNFKEKINCFLSVLKERKKFILLSKKSKGYKKNLLLFTGNSFFSPGNYLNLMSVIQLKEILKHSNKKNLITTFEGFGWERLFYHHGHKSNKHFKCIGYQHTLIFKYQHSLTRTLSKSFNPDLIFCSGITSAKSLKKKIKNKNISIKVLGSPKVFKKKIYDPINSEDSILFVPSGDIEEAEYMLNFATGFANQNKKISIMIRFHPILANLYSNKIGSKLDNIKISFSSLEQDCKFARWIIYTSSTAVYEGIYFNCIPIRLNCNLASDLSDPLWQIKSKLIKSLSTYNELSKFISLSKKSESYRIYSSYWKDLFIQVNKLRSNLKLDLIRKEI